MEQSHSVCDSLVRQRDEALREAERLRTSFRDVERTLGTRERAHRHRVKGLEEQVHLMCRGCAKLFFIRFNSQHFPWPAESGGYRLLQPISVPIMEYTLCHPLCFCRCPP